MYYAEIINSGMFDRRQIPVMCKMRTKKCILRLDQSQTNVTLFVILVSKIVPPFVERLKKGHPV